MSGVGTVLPELEAFSETICLVHTCVTASSSSSVGAARLAGRVGLKPIQLSSLGMMRPTGPPQSRWPGGRSVLMVVRMGVTTYGFVTMKPTESCCLHVVGEVDRLGSAGPREFHVTLLMPQAGLPKEGSSCTQSSKCWRHLLPSAFSWP